MFRFENLEIWKSSIKYANRIYNLTESFPKHELFGLSSQIRRASLSISSNIAEGSGSTTVKDFSNYLDISIKSTFETISQLFFALERKYISDTQLKQFYLEGEILVKKIQSFKYSLKRKLSAISNQPLAKL